MGLGISLEVNVMVEGVGSDVKWISVRNMKI